MDTLQSLTRPSETVEALSEEQRELVRGVIAKYGGAQDLLIQILHEVQEIVGYLPTEAQALIASELDLSLSRVSGVVSFYSLFSTEPKGRHTIHVCLGTACYVRGGKKVLEKLNDTLDLPVGGTSADGRFSLDVMRCIGACGLAPAVSIDDEVHQRVNPNKLNEILKKYE